MLLISGPTEIHLDHALLRDVCRGHVLQLRSPPSARVDVEVLDIYGDAAAALALDGGAVEEQPGFDGAQHRVRRNRRSELLRKYQLRIHPRIPFNDNWQHQALSLALAPKLNENLGILGSGRRGPALRGGQCAQDAARPQQLPPELCCELAGNGIVFSFFEDSSVARHRQQARKAGASKLATMCPVVLASISDSNCPAATRPRIRRASARRETSATSALAAEAAASAAAKSDASAPGASEKPGAAGG
eukprot:CAMPEP_0177498446 /NCGR_PEP_ID=MMETSP0369-20130122/35585_1 /TAXON_ID=447022 ORGANISM="Scrippsiella hangoei-like, Strain SHHI-4" /NCGR_SAMPLE_ID=MMETSP0369 /ASSEMBLY_ACC=CAM_ASM_000364 /LENGTH=246 /DNA_ID=CAMNT_0018975665 /DNA_START=34 /DNA_END=772 /DNA_ORIENTATION=-